MSTPIIDFAAALEQAIAAGQTVVEGNVVKIIADNGAEVANVTYKVIEGGNGVSSEAAVITGEVAAGTATTSGLALMTMEVGTVGAALAPALGILAGVGLYALAPDFWNKLSDELMEAGKTVGGKVIGFFDGENVYYDEQTIEIVKNALLVEGIFEYTYSDAELPAAQVDTKLYNPNNSPNPVHLTPRTVYIEDIYEDRFGNRFKLTIPLPSGVYAYGSTGMAEVPTATVTFVSLTPQTITGSRYNYKTGATDSLTINVTSQRTTKSGTTYYQDGISTSISDKINGFTFNSGNDLLSNYDNDCAAVIFEGDIENIYNDNLQPGATYPSENPFPATYPEWYPLEYPSTAPANLPTVYPVKYPGTQPDPYPEQEPAQNPQPENVPDTYPYIIPDLNVPYPTPVVPPTPDIPIDPDPQPEPDPIPTPENPVTPSDPVDPNPDPPVSPAIPVASLPDTVSSNKLFTVYNPSSAQLDALGGYLWDASLMAALRDIWQDPLDGIISLIQVYATPATSSSHNIILGYLDSGVSAPVVSSQFVTIDCGTIDIDETKANATDYAPYTSLHLFLPFIGIVELDTAECMNGSITVKYKVDVYTGTCLAQVSITRSKDMPNDPILYTYSGNCSQQIPLTSGNATGVLSALIGGITAGLSVASGGGLGVVAGATIAGNSLTHEMFHVTHSGNISANAGIMGQKKPYLIIGRRHCYDANGYNTFYGFPANKTIVLGNHTGYAKVKKCWLKTTATNSEYNMILNALKEGIIL